LIFALAINVFFSRFSFEKIACYFRLYLETGTSTTTMLWFDCCEGRLKIVKTSDYQPPQ